MDWDPLKTMFIRVAIYDFKTDKINVRENSGPMTNCTTITSTKYNLLYFT